MCFPFEPPGSARHPGGLFLIARPTIRAHLLLEESDPAEPIISISANPIPSLSQCGDISPGSLGVSEKSGKWGYLMKWSGLMLPSGCHILVGFCMSAMGCAVSRPGDVVSLLPPTARVVIAAERHEPLAETSLLKQVSFRQEAASTQVLNTSVSAENPTLQAGELSVDELIQHVLARNPSLAQMSAAWQAAEARYPQVTSLDDPMFGGTVGPASIGSRDVDFGYRLEVSQKLPFPGKLRLKGQAALAEAAASGSDVEDMRLQLIEAAKNAFFDYYLVDRALAVNEEHLRRLKEAKQNAESRFTNNQAPEQDVFQANVEIGRQQERELTLHRMREVAIARINTLMHLPPDSPLPPPPKVLRLAEELPPVGVLRAAAHSRRPDLQALAARLDSEQAALGLAAREFYPDFELMAAYDAFWQPMEKDLRPQLGVRLNLPIQTTRRQAAVSEAQAKLAQRHAELDKLTDQVNYQVQEAYAQVRESEKSTRLYEKTILPAAEANVKEALTAYTTGKIPFLSLIEAQRNLVNVRDRSYEVIADYYRRRATLERVIGGPLAPLTATLDHK